jgi:hypothetical protein
MHSIAVTMRRRATADAVHPGHDSDVAVCIFAPAMNTADRDNTDHRRSTEC